MRAGEFITEIERIGAGSYRGGKSYLRSATGTKQLKPLPGGSGFLYSIENPQEPVVKLWDPANPQADKKPRRDPYEFRSEYESRLKAWQERKQGGAPLPLLIGKLTLDSVNFPLKGALQVGTITVDEDYRGQGLGKALYGIVLTILNRPLVAGGSQTPGGRANWVSLSQIPGVVMKGYVGVDDDDLNTDPDDSSQRTQKRANENIDTIMGKLGGEYIGKVKDWGDDQHYFAFDVQPNTTGKELEAYIETQLSRVYHSNYLLNSGLYAIWTGSK